MDSAKRLKIIQDAMQLMHDDPPSVFLHLQEWVFAASPKIQGLKARPDAIVWFDDIHKSN
jgi:hypothetical protein